MTRRRASPPVMPGLTHGTGRTRLLRGGALLVAIIITLSTTWMGALVAQASDVPTAITLDDFESGSLAGWRSAGGGSGGWFAYSDGTTAPDPEMVSLQPFGVPDPPQGRFAAVTDMNGWGTFILYRDVDLRDAFTLHLTAFYESATPWGDGETLRWDDFSAANQQFRIDILDRSAPFDSVADGDVLVNVVRTDPTAPGRVPPTGFSVDLSALAGRIVRVRLAVATNVDVVRAGVDDIRFEPRDEAAEIGFPATAPAPGAPGGDGPALAAPTGSFPVGRTELRVGDPAAGESRVALWYPAEDASGSAAPYVTAGESRTIMLGTAPVYGPSWDVLSTADTHAVEGAQPLDGELPLVVLLPGLVLPASSLSGLAVDLASRGYAVAAIDPGAVAAGSPAGRAAEASLIVSELIEDGPVRIDAQRIAAVGHSWGGEAVALAMRDDPRFRAGISFDTTFPPDLDRDLDRPFLMLDTPVHLGEATSSNWRHLTGWRRWLIIDGSEHMSFTDYPSLLEQLGVAYFSGTIAGERVTEIVRSHVAAFLDQHLLGIPGSLLDGPSSRFGEVTFQDPDQP